MSIFCSKMNSLMSLSEDTYKLEDRSSLGQCIKPSTIFSPFVLSLRRRGIALKVYCCFVDFQKAFDCVPSVALFQTLRAINIFKALLTTIMHLYKSVIGHLCIAHRVSNFIKSIVGVRQGCLLPPTLFGIYIDELESFLHEHFKDGDGCLLP